MDTIETPQPRDFNAFDEVKRAIVVCAHADDLETMMGGTVYMLAQRGVEINELICTAGDLGSNDPRYTRQSLAEIRREEAKRGADVLGVKEVVVLHHSDGELEPSLDLRAVIALHYRRWQPDTLFTFDPDSPAQIHPDHRAVGRAALDAFMPSKMRLYRPEQLANANVADIKQVFLFGPANPTIFVDASDVYDKKIEACIAHASQFPEGDKNLDWMRQLDIAAAKRSGTNAQYAEQFGVTRVW